VFSKTWEEHKVHVQKVLQRLQHCKYYAKLHKCRFFQSEVPFLGHVVRTDGIKVDPKKWCKIGQSPRMC
jgi:hypothetical protein